MQQLMHCWNTVLTMDTLSGKATLVGISAAIASLKAAPSGLRVCGCASVMLALFAERPALPSLVSGAEAPTGRNKFTERLPRAVEPTLLCTLHPSTTNSPPVYS